MTNTTSDGAGGSSKGGPSARRTSAQQQLDREQKERREVEHELERERQQRQDAQQRLDHAFQKISELQGELLLSRAVEEECRATIDEVRALNEDHKQKYDSLVRDALLGSALDGLSTSLQNLDTTLGSKLAPLAILNTLTSARAEVDVVDVGRFGAVQSATARFDSNSYVVRRATIVEPGPTSSAAATSATAP